MKGLGTNIARLALRVLLARLTSGATSRRPICKYPLVRWEITGIAEKRLRESTLLQVVPKGQARLPSSACLSQSFSYHADLLEDDGDGLRTPPGARGGAGQLI